MRVIGQNIETNYSRCTRPIIYYHLSSRIIGNPFRHHPIVRLTFIKSLKLEVVVIWKHMPCLNFQLSDSLPNSIESHYLRLSLGVPSKIHP